MRGVITAMLHRTPLGSSTLSKRNNTIFPPENRFKAWNKKNHASGIFFQFAGNKAAIGRVVTLATTVAPNPVQQDQKTMTFSTRIALGISAAALSLSLVLAPAAFAQDKMGKDDGMKKEAMPKHKMKKASMSKDGMAKDDGMKKDGMMKNDEMKK
jgi:pentapeptide MXKDX repeat protein